MKRQQIIKLLLFLNIIPTIAFGKGIIVSSKADLTDAAVTVSLSTFPLEERNNLSVFFKRSELINQLDDLDGDGIADEMSFMLDLKKGQSIKLTIKSSERSFMKDTKSEVFTSLIKKGPKGEHIQVKEISSDKNDMYNKLHHHGVAMESDKMAYRIYFDNKSTIDIYGKKKYRLELPETYWYPSEEQLKEGYGDDILLVSGWVGNGALKGWDGKKALHIEKFEKRTQRILASGPLRAVVESEVKGWEYEGKKVDIKVRYILFARHRDVLAEVTSSEDLNAVATGVQEIGKGELLQENDLVGSWGSWYPQPDSVKYRKDTVGLGLYMSPGFKGRQVLDRSNNLIVAPLRKGEILRYYFTTVAVKEREQKIKDAGAFFEYLKNWSKDLEAVEVQFVN